MQILQSSLSSATSRFDFTPDSNRCASAVELLYAGAMDAQRTHPPNYKHGDDIRERTFAFACEVVKFCEKLHRIGGAARVLAPQLLRSSTSVAGMLEEARASESDRDFISKCSIGLKECRETHVRLRICVTCALGQVTAAKALSDEANQLVAILTAILRNKRRAMKSKGTG